MTDVSCYTLTLHDRGRMVEYENDPVNKSLYSSTRLIHQSGITPSYRDGDVCSTAT
jgi:hypothetical protein